MQDADAQTDKLMRNERRGVWLSLAIVLILATSLVLDSDMRRAVLLSLSVAIVFAVIWLRGQRTQGTTHPAGAARDCYAG